MRILLIMVFLLSNGIARAADCSTELAATDSYRELSAKLKCLNDRINVLENTAPAQAPVILNTAPAADAHTQEAGGIRIELESCSKSGNTVACRIFVTAMKGDRSLYLRSSGAVDRAGVVLRSIGFQMPGKKIDTGVLDQDLIGNARTAVTAFFANENVQISDSLTAVHFRYNLGHTNSSDAHSVTLRDIECK